MLGTAKRRQRTSAPARADALADVTLPDQAGTPVRLGDLWAERPAALVWLRHYGWVHCRDHAVQLHRAREEFEAADVTLVLIGQETPRHAKRFRSMMDIDLPVLADKKRQSYKAAGAKVATVGELLGPQSVGKGLTRSVRSAGRIRQGRVVGHPAQLGGSMVVRPDGSVAFAHMSEDASDNASPEELLAAARAAAQGWRFPPAC